MSAGIIFCLERLRDALAILPGVQSCKIGLEANLSPDDYPIIRIVPSTLRPHPERRWLMECEALIYYGAPIQPFDDAPDSQGRTRLEKLYAALLELDASIRATVSGRYFEPAETTLDEDRLETYKLMALKVKVIA